MSDSPVETTSDAPRAVSPWRMTGWLCFFVVLASTVSCITLAMIRSTGLAGVVVTAASKEAEPRDHALPLIKRKEALPDYQVIVLLHDGGKINLGTKPDTSAVDGLEWRLGDPVSITDVAGVRLQDQDKVVSDVLAEVQIDGSKAVAGNYEFQFRTERSMSVGVQSFFNTPIGKAIVGAFFVAVLLMVVSVLCV